MTTPLTPNRLRECRDLIKGRRTAFGPEEHIVADYAALRFRIKSSYPPLRGEYLRKTILAGFGMATLLTSLFVLLAA